MDRKVSTTYNAVERMLLDKNAEPIDMPLSLLEEITKCFSDDRRIGSGGFAVVYKGFVRNGLVAVKKLSNTFDMHESKFHKEIECLMKTKHKNIVRFLGYCSDTQGKLLDFEGKKVMADIRNWLLCFEYVPNGSLKNHITDASRGLEWRERYQIIKGICEGLRHLHEKRILHLDLKPGNVLIDDHMIPKIADFGLSRCLDKEQSRVLTSHICGSQGYLAPEFYSGQIAFASDIYGLGVIIVEILTGKKGYPQDDKAVKSWMNRLKPSDQREALLEQLRVCVEIGIECMDFDPNKRPAAKDIVERLDKTEHGVYSCETAIISSSHNPPTSSAHSSGDEVLKAMAAQRMWVRERSTEWLDHLSDPACPVTEFRRAFRMSRATFDMLCAELSVAITKEDTALRAPIRVHQRVAVCLWRLATGEPLREVSRRFGLGISTCHNIVLQVCAALTAILLPKAVHWPLDSSTSRFEAVFGIPGVVGAVCTDHIPIGLPKENVAEYYNRSLTERNNKASYAVALQAVVDADGAFMDVCIGLPGSLPDAAVFDRSPLYARCKAGLLEGGQCRLVGGASYPLTDWMLVPYRHQNLTWAQHVFNQRVAAADAAARFAFQRLKARWRCLQRRTEAKRPDLHNIIGACCALHNFCERSSEELDTDLESEPSQEEENVDEAAKTERDRIASGLLAGATSFHFLF